MSWFSQIVDTIAGQRSVDFVFTPALMVGTKAPNPQTLPVDDCYIDLRVSSVRIPKSRKFTSNFYGVVHAFTTVVRERKVAAETAAVLAPKNLYNVDPAHANRAVMVDERVMGLMPWRGDVLKLELGLFSVKAADLVEPYVDFLGKLAGTTGVGCVSAVTPFVPLIKDGIQLLTGPKGGATLEVGISKNFDGVTGTYALIGRDKADFDMSKLSVDPSDHKLLFNNQPLDNVAYLVFEIRMTDRQPGYGSIPELSDAFDAVANAAKEADAREALVVLKRKLLWSPDLITTDATKLYQMIKDRVDRTYGAGLTADEGGSALPKTLAEVKLYD
jgi:hypothetical protein